MDLFPPHPDSEHRRPLAARMRPQALADIAGQEQLVGEGKLLRRAIEADRIGSIILDAIQKRHVRFN